MTIHQAKGLSLPVEYFYWNPGRRSGNNQSSLNFYLEFDEKYDQLTNYLLIQDQYLPILDWLDYDFKDQAEKKAELEEVNNLYVALSRVEKELHIFIEAPRTIKPDQQLMWSGSNYDYYEKMLLKATGVKNLLELITPWQKGSIVKVESEKFTQPQPLIDLNKYLSQTAANQSLLQQQQEEKYRFFRAKNNELELSEKRLSGLALHYYLENIKYNQPAEKITARKLVNNKYGNLLGKEKINSLIEQGERFISSNKDLFEQDKQIFTEYLLKEKTAQSVKKYRIDRLIVDQFQQKIKIIDYKSGSYRDPEQLLKYKKLLQNQLDQNWEIETEFLNI
jgi:ATP-dependent exoDNAse (exonuclease V) beta subunit